MELKYFILIVSIVNVAKINAHQIEFQNLQIIDYNTKNALNFGDIHLNGFQNIGNKYYRIESKTKMTWWDAYFTCRTLNSSLATIETVKELENLSPYLMKLNSQNAYWVGGTDMYKEGEWKLMDTGKNIPRGNLWTANQPDNTGGVENCAFLWRDGGSNMFRLNDWICNGATYYICEREAPKAVSFINWCLP